MPTSVNITEYTVEEFAQLLIDKNVFPAGGVLYFEHDGCGSLEKIRLVTNGE